MTKKISILIVLILIFSSISYTDVIEELNNEDDNIFPITIKDTYTKFFKFYEIKKPKKVTLSFVGDVTLGEDFRFSGKTFTWEYRNQDNNPNYFFEHVKPYFENDDFTFINLETTLTHATIPAEKKYVFKAPPEYVNILKSGHIEIANIENNHSHDYLSKGLEDTIKTLKDNSIKHVGYGNKHIEKINDINIGFLSYNGFSYSKANKTQIKKDIEEMKKECDLIVIHFHWGIERDNYPNDIQKNLAHWSIDSGANLVVGDHPHVLQSIENYKGSYIVYSLANFSFGGNRNPSDKDTIIFRPTFIFKDEKLNKTEIEIIPCSISSISTRNDYRPTPLINKEGERILQRINKYSKGYNFYYDISKLYK